MLIFFSNFFIFFHVWAMNFFSRISFFSLSFLFFQTKKVNKFEKKDQKKRKKKPKKQRNDNVQFCIALAQRPKGITPTKYKGGKRKGGVNEGLFCYRKNRKSNFFNFYGHKIFLFNNFSSLDFY